MYQPYQHYQPYQRQQEYMQPGMQQSRQEFAIRYVSSKTEVEAAQVQFDGTPAYFENIASGEIYKKAFRMDGTAPVVTYRIVQEAPPTQYATIEQLNMVIAELEKMKKEKEEADE